MNSACRLVRSLMVSLHVDVGRGLRVAGNSSLGPAVRLKCAHETSRFMAFGFHFVLSGSIRTRALVFRRDFICA